MRLREGARVMKCDLTVSVALAAYNGATYIKEQMDSILGQLGPNDEVVVSLDPSKDETQAIIETYCAMDRRVRLYMGKGLGAIKNFENAIMHCQKDIIFLADQDDVWLPNKREKIVQQFLKPQVQVVLHDAIIVDAELKTIQPSFFEVKNSQSGIFRNIVKNSYMGCCMAFRRSCLDVILPFPKNIPMHDQWMGLCCEWVGKAVLMPEQLLLYRRHGANVSEMQHASLAQMIRWRVSVVGAFVARNIFKMGKKLG